ncbi:MAG: hypothetical protein A3H79_03020 [Candidatus Levybacteria bacterium RIFCSPLOWO2_02_FULL_36_8b]|nr:MAG: hypothetical protein A3H79_03020 [Candidatus Levybacteria bacterium RIFCSPLOWO2_02_FULL_36_8b]
MTENLKKHTIYYLSLLTILVIGIYFALNTSYDKTLQTVIIVLTVLAYIIWGIMHHLANHDLKMKIVVEYVLVGGLGLSIILFLLRV